MTINALTTTIVMWYNGNNRVITELEKKMKESPCYKCEKRCPSCHGSCEDYISWNTERKMWIEAEKGDKIMSAYYAERDTKWRRKHKHVL